MKIYKVYMCLRLVIGRLQRYNLYEYNSNNPIIFVKADNPDEACHKAYLGLSSLIIKGSRKNKKTLEFIREILDDVRVLTARVADETQL